MASDCNICLGASTDDLEACEFYRSKIVAARKAHHCDECREQILPRQKYEDVYLKCDGEFQGFKTCLICCELRTAFSCDDTRICHGMLWEEIADYLFPEMTTGCLKKIRTVEAKDFLVKRWNEWKFRPRRPASAEVNP